MQKKQKIFLSSAGANQRSLACEVTALTITLHASHGMAAVKTASNIDRGDTIAQVATGAPPTAERPSQQDQRGRTRAVCLCPLAKPVPVCIYRDPNTKGKLSAKYQFCAIHIADNSIFLQTVKSGWSAL